MKATLSGGSFALKEDKDCELMAAVIAKFAWALNQYFDEEEVYEYALEHLHKCRTPNGERFIDVHSMEKLARIVRASIEIPANSQVN